MRRLFFTSLTIFLLAVPAQAQQVFCSTPTTGDNSNRCAPTNWVQSAISGIVNVPQYNVALGTGANSLTGAAPTSIGGAFISNGAAAYPSFTLTPTWTGLHTFNAGARWNNLLTNNYSSVGTATDFEVQAVNAGGVGKLQVLINNVESWDTGDYSAFYINTHISSRKIGGAGSREALHIVQEATRGRVGNMIVGLNSIGHLIYDGVTFASHVFGGNSYAWVDAGLDPGAEAVGHEINTDVRGTVARKVGLHIFDVETSIGGGTVYDFGMLVGKVGAARGYDHAIRLGQVSVDEFNIALISSPPGVIGRGIDLSASTFTTASLMLPRFAVLGSGDVTVGNGRASDGVAYVNFQAEQTPATGGTSAQLARTGGADGNLQLLNYGAGVTIVNAYAGAVSLLTSNTPRLTIGPTGVFDIAGSNFALNAAGAITLATWQGTAVAPAYGGTGVNNGTKTITLGGNLTTAGAYNLTLTQSGATNVTLPTSGTLAALSGTNSWSGVNAFTNTTDSTSPTTGAVQITGGLGVAKSAYFGGNYLTLTPGGGDAVLGVGVGRSTQANAIASFQTETSTTFGYNFRMVRYSAAAGNGALAGVAILQQIGAGALSFMTIADGGQVGHISFQPNMVETLRLWNTGGVSIGAAGSFADPGAGNVQVTGTLTAGSGIGYATGAGGTVTQATSKSTGVTLNKVSGEITLNNAALAAGTTVGFTLTNSAIAAADLVAVAIKSGATANSYTVTVTAVAAGSCRIELRNTSGGSLSEAVVLSFVVIKGVTS